MPSLLVDIDPVDIVASLPATLVAMLVALVLPLLVGLVTKSSTNTTVKAVLLALLSGVTALLAQATVTDGQAVITWGALFAFVAAFVTAVGSHFGFWKPTGVTAKTQDVGVHD